MKSLKVKLLEFIKLLLFVLPFYFITRLLFFPFNQDYYTSFNLFSFLGAFLWGLRFDIASLLIFNIPLVLWFFFPFRNQLVTQIGKISFVVFNTIALGFNIVDYEFFRFNGKRLTVDVLQIGGEFQNQIFQIAGNFWHITLFIILIFGILFKFFPLLKKSTSHSRKDWGLYPFIVLGILVLQFIGIRGGVQMRSLSPKDAFIFDSTEYGNLALNSSYTFIRSLEDEELAKKKYFKSDTEAFKKIKINHQKTNQFYVSENKNIILFIIESLSQEYVDAGHAPFIQSLAEKGVYSRLNFANGRRSIEVLPSIMLGFPSLIGKSISQSRFQVNRFVTLPGLLKKNGYKTLFFHGGKNGTMDFDSYTRSIGFDRYFGMNEYSNSGHYDGNWGIFDHYFLEKIGDELGSLSGKFFATYFSLSSHQPYTIPDNLKGQFKKGTIEIHESIQYADFAVKNFFEKNKDKEWFQNSLFIITADHTSKLSTKEFHTKLGKYRVPLILYDPKEQVQLQLDYPTQHADILPTIIDLFDIKTPQLHFGKSIFDSKKRRVLNFTGRSFLYLKDTVLTEYTGQKAQSFKYDNDLVSKESEAYQDNNALEELKALIQYGYNGLIKNNIYSHEVKD